MTESAAPPPSTALESALHAEGFDVTVRADGRLAIVVPRTAAGARAELRARVWPLARAAGFTHAAIELVDEGGETGRAPDRPAAHAAVRRD